MAIKSLIATRLRILGGSPEPFARRASVDGLLLLRSVPSAAIAMGSRLKQGRLFTVCFLAERKKHFDNFQSGRAANGSYQMLATQGAGKRCQDDENTICLPIRHGVSLTPPDDGRRTNAAD
jgi:hypothetical protein